MANFPTNDDDVITGTSGTDTINGLDGNDVISGLDDADDLDGGAGNDTLNGDAGNDILRVSGTGTDAVNGGADTDWIVVNWVDSTAAVLAGSGVSTDANGGFAGQFADESSRSVSFTGVEQFDLTTGSGNDRLATGSGSDLVSLGLGDDFVDVGRGVNRVDGGNGDDGFSADFSQHAAGFVIDLRNLINNGLFGNYTRVEYVGTIVGTAVNDTITTTALDRDETFDMGGGNDTVSVFNGDDTFLGGAGTDRLVLNWADSTSNVVAALALAANATLGGYDGKFDDGAGRSATYNSVERFFVTTGSGADSITTGLADDRVTTNAGNDEVHAGAGADIVQTGADDDIVDGGEGADSMSGGTGDDDYFVDDAGDTISENFDEGDDSVATALADFTLPEYVEQLIYTGSGSALLRGNTGDNSLTGGAFNDIFHLEQGGNDTAVGGAGRDVFYFGGEFGEDDDVDGGEHPGDFDVLVLQGDYFDAFGANLAGIEGVSLQSGSVTRWGQDGTALYDYVLNAVEALVAPGETFRVNAQSLQADEDLVFDGSDETDGGRFLIYAGFGEDSLSGGSGNDIFFFEAGRFGAEDGVEGGGGADAVVISGVPDGASGPLQLTIAAFRLSEIEAISFNGRFASDPTATPSYEIVLENGNVGSVGTLIVNGSSLGAAQSLDFDGSQVADGNLTLYGGAGADTLEGGSGADLFLGGRGADTLKGNGGADVFQYDAVLDSPAGAGTFDTILAFTHGADRIDLSRIDANGAAAGDVAFSWIGEDAFGGSGPAARLRAEQVDAAANLWRVEGDTNGDGAADFVLEILVEAGQPLEQSDFLL